MKIKFDTATINEREATGVIALLMELYPNIGAPDETKSSLWVSYTPQTGSEQASPVEKTITEAVEETPPEHDANGRPWDARIHSTPAKQNADGTWRAKRGVTAELVAEVEAELAGETIAEEVQRAEPELSDDTSRVEMRSPEEAEQKAASIAPPPPPPAPTVTFPVVMKKITDNKILPARVQELLAPFGIKSVGELLKPDRAADLVKFSAEIDKELVQ